MTKYGDGGAAFPIHGIDAPIEFGMTLRDYFAALAMHAELNTAGANKGAAKALNAGAQRDGHTVEDHIAYNAYGVADAMLKIRQQSVGDR